MKLIELTINGLRAARALRAVTALDAESGALDDSRLGSVRLQAPKPKPRRLSVVSRPRGPHDGTTECIFTGDPCLALPAPAAIAARQGGRRDLPHRAPGRRALEPHHWRSLLQASPTRIEHVAGLTGIVFGQAEIARHVARDLADERQQIVIGGQGNREDEGIERHQLC